MNSHERNAQDAARFPKVGDCLVRGKSQRTVTKVSGGEVHYVTVKGVNRSCWPWQWTEWAKHATLVRAGSLENRLKEIKSQLDDMENRHRAADMDKGR